MKILTIIIRILLGLAFTVFGLNMFFGFIHAPPPPPGHAGEYMTALFASHYIYVIGAFQLVGGLLLLIGRWVPLGLALLWPVIVNILCFHIFLNREGLPLAIVVAVLGLFLVWRYRAAYAGLFKP